MSVQRGDKPFAQPPARVQHLCNGGHGKAGSEAACCQVIGEAGGRVA